MHTKITAHSTAVMRNPMPATTTDDRDRRLDAHIPLGAEAVRDALARVRRSS